MLVIDYPSIKVVRVDKAVAQLMKLAEESGLDSGWQGLSEEPAVKSLQSQLEVLGVKRYGVSTPTVEELTAREDELVQEKESLQVELAARRQQRRLRPVAASEISEPRAQRLKRTVNSALLFVAAALASEAFGIRLGWTGLSALALLVAFAAINLEVLRRLVVGLVRWLGYVAGLMGDGLGRALLSARLLRLQSRISRLKMRRDRDALAHQQAAQWLALHRNLILDHFTNHRARARKAAHLRSGKMEALQHRNVEALANAIAPTNHRPTNPAANFQTTQHYNEFSKGEAR